MTKKEKAELRRLWLASRRGDDEARRKLAALIAVLPGAERKLLKIAAGNRANVLGKRPAAESTWTRAANSRNAGWVGVVGGGLPSLGKKK